MLEREAVHVPKAKNDKEINDEVDALFDGPNDGPNDSEGGGTTTTTTTTTTTSAPIPGERYWASPVGIGVFQGMRIRGLAIDKIAESIGLTDQQFSELLVRHPQISDALILSSDVANNAVLGAAFKRAVGYNATESSVMESGGEPTTVTKTKHIPADSSILKMWLYNRVPDLFSAEVSAEESGPKSDQLSALSTDELRAMISGISNNPGDRND